jgi:6-phosphogluconolactonase
MSFSRLRQRLRRAISYQLSVIKRAASREPRTANRELRARSTFHPLPFETIVASPDELARVFATRVSGAARRARADGRALSLVVPGGSIAQAFFPVLADAAIDWTMVDVFWSDERAVGPDHEDSNYRVAKELLLSHAGQARAHRMPADDPDLDAAASTYERELVRVLGDRPRFDVVLLGVGPDGHVCSLFPGHPTLEEASRLVVAVADSPKPPPRRLTLTLPALAGAEIFIAAFGAAKRDVIREALWVPASPLPVARAARSGAPTIFLLDTHSSQAR